MKLKETRIGCFIELPDMISLLNLSFGFLAILMSFNEEITIASIFIIMAAIFDSVDGWIARKLSRNDELNFGKNIDSLSDVVSFGIAPSILLYVISSHFSLEISYLTGIVALFISICGVLRLARFNVISDKIDFEGFIGLPIPIIGVLISVLILSGFFNIYLALILSIIIGFLMVSNLKYIKINNPIILVITLFLIILVLIPYSFNIHEINIPASLLFIMLLIYIFINPLITKYN